MRIAVTGGRGRLAPGLAVHLRDRGHEVVLYSRVPDERVQSVADLLRPGGLRGIGAVLHLGWSTVPLLAEQRPGIEQEQDLPFVRALVEAAAMASNVKLVFFSTAAVYGDTGSEPATEESPCDPLGRYAAAKLEAERVLVRHRNTCLLRISNVVGGWDPQARLQGIVPVLVRAACSGSAVTIWGDGSATKDYLAAPDLHRAVEILVAKDERGVFNVASGEVLSVNELVALVEAATGRPIRTNHQQRYSWDIASSHISASKLSRATGWRPECLLREFVSHIAD